MNINPIKSQLINYPGRIIYIFITPDFQTHQDQEPN